MENTKKYLRLAIIFALVVGSLSAIWYARAYSKSLTYTYGSFTVAAEGKVVTVPDIAQLDLTVLDEGGKDLAALQKKNVDKMNAITSFLKEKGVEEKDIKTTAYSVNPRYQYSPCYTGNCRAPEIIGYSISQSVQVKVRKLDTVGDILAGAVEKGANTVSGPVFVIDDATKAQDDARAEAIAKARAKAQSMAKAGNFRLGKILGIEEGGNGSMPMPAAYDMMERSAAPMMGGAMMTKVAAPVASTNVQPGSQEVVVNVVVTYEIR